LKVKKGIKYILYNTIYYSGFYYFLRRLSESNSGEGLLILNYHSVVPPDKVLRLGFTDLSVTTTLFQEQIQYIKQRFTFLSLSEVLNIIRDQAEFPPKSCLLTFDDGWRDNYEYMFPIIRQENVPAVIFAASELCQSGDLYWTNILWHLIFKRLITDSELATLFPGVSIGRINSDELKPGKVDGVCHRLFSIIGGLDEKTRDTIQEEIIYMGRKRIPDILNKAYYLNWNEMREMLKSGLIEFGTHGHHHDPLAWYSGKSLFDQLSKSKRILETNLERDIVSFSYPHSRSNQECIEAAREVGYEVGFNSPVTRRLNNSREYHPLSLIRVPVLTRSSTSPKGNFSPAIFNCQLEGIIQ